MRVNEDGPRVLLRNRAMTVPTPVKIALIEKLADAGPKAIEAGRFASPEWVPQMAGTAGLLAAKAA
jgi:isopropylmalate/homocitrate/citramalate synthase